MRRILPAAGLVLALGSASAATFNVINLNDSGAGSLRDAVAQANANAGPDTITFSVTGTILLTSGALNISAGPLSIVGPGATSLTVDGNASNRIFTIFENVPDLCATPNTDFAVSISGLTLTNARRSTDNSGGAIFSEKTLTLTSVVVSNSQAKNGGGLSFQAAYAGQTLTIDKSRFTNNIARPFPSSTSGTNGGGLFIAQRCTTAPTPVTITITNSEFSGNHAQPTVFLDSAGAGIHTSASVDVTITDTRITGNSIDAPSPPVAGANYRGAGLSIVDAKSVTIERTEISDNSSDRNGGLRVVQSLGSAFVAKVVNSTISGNVAVAPPAGAAAAIGLSGNVALQLDNATVASNVALSGSAVGVNISANAGSTPTMTVRSSVLSNPALSADIGLDVTVSSSTVNASQSLIRALGTGVTVSGSGNLIGSTALLGPLAFNGGNTRTQAILPGSPGLGTGSNPLNLLTDQRGPGFPRTTNGVTDMGAYQTAAAPPPTPVSTAPIPTLSEYALWLLALLTAALGAIAIRRRG